MAAPAVGRQRHLLIVENARPLARIRPPHLVPGQRARGHQTRAQQTLHVEDLVEPDLAHFPHQAQESLGAGIPLKHVHLVDGLAGAHDRGKDVADNPGNAQALALGLQRGCHLQAVHDVPEGRGFDDEKLGHESRGGKICF